MLFYIIWSSSADKIIIFKNGLFLFPNYFVSSFLQMSLHYVLS